MKLEPDKLPLTSMDVADEKRRQLKQLFPEAFTEAKDPKTGELKHLVDFEKLKASLGEVLEKEGERFGLSWPGKSALLKVIQQPSIGTLKPCREESVNFDSTENLFIEGDNLEVLKLLQKSYFGKVKMIYIDPPYNTGNEFVYPDNFTESLETYLQYTGMVDSLGRKFSTNTATEGRFHSKWLNMMYPRLFLARNLLREDGVIFISIDDNELNSLMSICNEIFGEENIIANFIWKSRQNKDNRPEKGASVDHEYVVCYGKKVRGAKRQVSQYSNPDDDERGDWTSANMVGLATADKRPNLHYDLINPETSINYGCPEMGWRYDQKTMSKLIAEKRILWPNSEEGRPRRKAFFNELESEFTGFSSIIGKDIYTRNGTEDVRSLFEARIMDFPKPVSLLREIIEQGLEDSGIVVDFFSGSCSTAHAVLDLNKEDGGNRKFIMVQLPEPCDEKSEAFKAGYQTIADIGKERIRRVIQKIEKEQEGKLDFSSEGAQQDLGFKVFKLSSSNFKLWQGDEMDPDKIKEQLEMHINHVDPKATAEDILYELLLKAGFPLTTKVEKFSIAGLSAYSISGGALIICLESELTKEAIRAIADRKPVQAICLDAAFHENDQLKTNAVQTMEAAKVQFRTV